MRIENSELLVGEGSPGHCPPDPKPTNPQPNHSGSAELLLQGIYFCMEVCLETPGFGCEHRPDLNQTYAELAEIAAGLKELQKGARRDL